MSELAVEFESLPPEYQRVLRLAQQRLGIQLTPLEELESGRTGGRLYLVSVARSEPGPIEHFVLKLDRVSPKARSDEFTRHSLAVSLAPPDFARQHIADLPFDRIEQDGAIAILYAIAGQSLHYFRTLASYDRQSQLETIFSATNHYLLSGWNAGLSFEQTVHPQSLLARWLTYRLEPGGNIERFLEDASGIHPDTAGLLIQGKAFPNPWAYARQAEHWGTVRPIDAIFGFQHGDLNIGNILVKFARDGADLEGYYLIDFALFKEGMPLLYDQRYLEVSYLIRELSRAPFAKWVDLVSRFAEQDILHPHQVPIELAGACAVIGAGRGAFDDWVQESYPSLYDDLWGQFWLAAVAAGLNYCNKAAIPEQERLAGLIFAAAHLKRYCARFRACMPVQVAHLYDAGQARAAPLFPAPPPVPGRPSSNLPAQLTPFIGREAHLAGVRQELARPEVRLLTLTGAGGTGKTRLSLQVAAELLDDFEDGVFFVELATIRDPALVVPTIARTLGVREFESRPILDSLKDFLRGKYMLLVLDNFEHLAPAAPLVSELLAAAPRLKVLVTSRASLRAYGEHEYLVPPMITSDPRALPPLEGLAGVEAVQLFVQRARAIKPDFALTRENAPAVAEICIRLDGLPLAIELAAARIRLLSPQEMLHRLDSRLGFLVGGPRDLPARQQTLRGAIDWSYDLLAAEEKTLLQRLAVFVGGCSLEAAEAVSNASGDLDVLRGLEGLVDKNLLQAYEVDGQPRFGMLETIREYALARLAASGEEEATRRRHAGFFVALAEEAEPELAGAEQVAWLNRLEVEHGNLRGALAWSIEREGEIGLRLAGALGTFWRVRGYHSEGRDWLARVLDGSQAGGADTEGFRAKALNSAGKLALYQGDGAAAYSMQEESVALWRKLGDRRGLAYALRELAPAAWRQGDLTQALSAIEGSVALFQQMEEKPGLAGALFWQGYLYYVVGDYDRAGSIAEECINLAREMGDINREARATIILGHIAFRQGDHAAAEPLYEKSLTLFRQARDQYGTSVLLTALGDLSYVQGDYERAHSFYEESLEISQAMGNQAAVAQMLCRLGGVSFHLDRREAARTLLAESLARWRELGDNRGIAGCFVELAGMYVGEQPERAARLLGTAKAFLEAGDTVPPATLQAEIRADYERNLAAVRAQVDEGAFAEAWTEGGALDLEATLTELLVELGG